MKPLDEKTPSTKEIEKEIGEFLAKKFGDNVKVVSPMVLPQPIVSEKQNDSSSAINDLHFDLKPEELISYLDQYIVKQDTAKAILATKICTHFNRIRESFITPENATRLVGGVKHNILMLGPTGVGKTYMIKLIADKLGVPFVKGDATKFSETGYVGGDVEDLVRDLVRAANDDTELAQFGIIYIDEIDKIAGSRYIAGADVSRTGVQRALLKPMEETEVDLKVPHDPISMIQEIENFRKTGKREKRSVNTANILFIMSGAFADLGDIVKKRIHKQAIGFSATLGDQTDPADILQQVCAEDLIQFGFESEFVGRLPIRAVFQQLEASDLYKILKNPNNPIILGKKLDFAAYGIEIKFTDDALKSMAATASEEHTGARGLVSAVEKVLLEFERRLPSSPVKKLAVTEALVAEPASYLPQVLNPDNKDKFDLIFNRVRTEEKDRILDYLQGNAVQLSAKYKLTFTPKRMDAVSDYYITHIMDVGKALEKIKSFYDDIKKTELFFYKNHDINIVLEEDAIDHIIGRLVLSPPVLDRLYNELAESFEHALRLVREKTGQSRFFITRDALVNPDDFVSKLLQKTIPDASHP